MDYPGRVNSTQCDIPLLTRSRTSFQAGSKGRLSYAAISTRFPVLRPDLMRYVDKPLRASDVSPAFRAFEMNEIVFDKLVALPLVWSSEVTSEASFFRPALEALVSPEARLLRRSTRSCVTARSLLVDPSSVDRSSPEEENDAADVELVGIDELVVPVPFSSSSRICSRAEEATAETFISKPFL